jgi:hypothetical protein
MSEVGDGEVAEESEVETAKWRKRASETSEWQKRASETSE